MSFIIRASNGERSITKITNKGQPTRSAIREEIVEALRGMTINFELKITDISNSRPVAPQEEKQDGATFADRAEDILTELKTKQANDQQQVPTQNGCAQPRIQQQPVRSSLSSNIRPVTVRQPSQPEPTRDLVMDGSRHEAKEESRAAPVLSQPSRVELEPVKPAILSVEPEKVVVEPEPIKQLEAPPKSVVAPAKTATLVRGSPKIGATLETCCIWYDDSSDKRVPYISYDADRLFQLTGMIQNMASTIESQPAMNSIDVGAIVFVKSKEDDAWYRAIVQRIDVENLDVLIFDWGTTETTDMSRIRRLAVLELGLSSTPALALRVRVSNPPGPLVEKFYECDSKFKLRVNAYDEFDETYDITLISQCEQSSTEM